MTDSHRDLVSRLGFGDNVSEPMADNDTIVEWFEQQSRDASEWQETQLWRLDCYDAGHPDDQDCYECDPTLIADADRAKVEAALALADEWDAKLAREFKVHGFTDWHARELRAVLGAPTTEETP